MAFQSPGQLRVAHVTGKFDAHLQAKSFLFANEAIPPADKPAESALKGMITDPSIAVERKGWGRARRVAPQRAAAAIVAPLTQRTAEPGRAQPGYCPSVAAMKAHYGSSSWGPESKRRLEPNARSSGAWSPKRRRCSMWLGRGPVAPRSGLRARGLGSPTCAFVGVDEPSEIANSARRRGDLVEASR